MPDPDVTRWLLELRTDRDAALRGLLPIVYAELRAIARRRLGSRSGDATLGTTELVHEAFVKLFDGNRLEVHDRHHFFAVAAMAMRQIVIDHARRRRAARRGGGVAPLSLDRIELPVHDRAEELLSLDEALRRLESLDARLARVVELRFFGGLSVEETAEVLDVDPRTVKRDWRKARAVLHRALAGEGPA
jgi:RNA polymerase sigma factor (TIGR02999 family)